MDVMQAIHMRRSVRRYLSRPIPQEVMGRMRQALRSAPSACNYQPWRFIFVTDADLRAQVMEVSFGNKAWMAAAPVIVVGCGLPKSAFKKMGGYGNSADVDVAIALDHLTLAAVADGLGTCWIGAFDEPAVKKVLGVPDDVKIVAMTPLGYPETPDLNHPLEPLRRKGEAEIFCQDRWSD